MKINIIAQLIDNKLIKIATFFRNSDANVLAWHPNEKPFMSKKKKSPLVGQYFPLAFI